MSTYKQIFYQIVFSTKHREQTIPHEHEEELYKYIWGIVKNQNCHLYRINGMPGHLHIFSDLHPSVSLADFIKDIKLASRSWMKQHEEFSEFAGWQDGYGAFTYSIKEKDMIIDSSKIRKNITKQKIFMTSIKGC